MFKLQIATCRFCFTENMKRYFQTDDVNIHFRPCSVGKDKNFSILVI